MSQRKEYRIWLVDDHLLLRENLANNIQAKAPNLHIEKQASNGKELIELLNKCKAPDLVILDLEMREYSGFKFLENKSSFFPHLKILILSMHSDELTVINAFRKSIMGYVTKNTSTDELIRAIDSVLNGKKYIQIDLEKYYDIESESLRGSLNDLNFTPKESEFIKLACSDYSYDEIAKMMNISLKTLETHRSNTHKKLNVRSRVGLMLVAQKNNWI
jgi:two-component system, NarL family, invasion response regulator UvrY